MNIGDRFLSELLDTECVDKDVFQGKRVFCPNPRTIYGGELMAQALVAASKTVPDGYKAHSLHCYFHGQSSIKQPNHYHVVRFRDGRSFSHRLVEAHPINESNNTEGSIPFFRMDCSFKLPEVDPACFVAAMPKVIPPEEVMDYPSFLKSLDIETLPAVPRRRMQQFLGFDKVSPMEIKICEPEIVLGLKSNTKGRLHAWIRLKEPPTLPLQPYRDALLSYFSDAVLLWVAITEPHPVNYLVTLNQSIWFHNPDVCPAPDEWILFQTQAHYVGDALTLSYGALWDREGRPLASVAQQGLMRTDSLTPVSSANGLYEQKGSNVT